MRVHHEAPESRLLALKEQTVPVELGKFIQPAYRLSLNGGT